MDQMAVCLGGNLCVQSRGSRGSLPWRHFGGGFGGLYNRDCFCIRLQVFPEVVVINTYSH